MATNTGHDKPKDLNFWESRHGKIVKAYNIYCNEHKKFCRIVTLHQEGK